jgi:hypothetical protein
MRELSKTDSLRRCVNSDARTICRFRQAVFLHGHSALSGCYQASLNPDEGRNPKKRRMTMTTTRQAPVHKIRHRSIEAAIWENEGKSGPFHAVTFQRLYKTGGEWKSSDTYSQADLLYLQQVAEAAYHWIQDNQPANAVTG